LKIFEENNVSHFFIYFFNKFIHLDEIGCWQVQMCIKVEQQNLRKSFSRRNEAQPNSYVNKDFKREEKKEEPPRNLAKAKEK